LILDCFPFFFLAAVDGVPFCARRERSEDERGAEPKKRLPRRESGMGLERNR